MSIDKLASALKHLPGKHPQKTHGHGGGGSGDRGTASEKSTTTRISRSDLIKANGGKSTIKFTIPRGKIDITTPYELPDGRVVVKVPRKSSASGNIITAHVLKGDKITDVLRYDAKTASKTITMDVGAVENFDAYGKPVFKGGKYNHQL